MKSFFFFWRRPQICACNPLHGANINITIRLNFFWHAHQMALFLSFHLCIRWFNTRYQTTTTVRLPNYTSGQTNYTERHYIGIEFNLPPFIEGHVRWFQGHLNCICVAITPVLFDRFSLFFSDTCCKYYNVTVLSLK